MIKKEALHDARRRKERKRQKCMQNRLSENGFIVKQTSKLSFTSDPESKRKKENSYRTLLIVPEVVPIVQAHAVPTDDPQNGPQNVSRSPLALNCLASPKMKIVRGDSYYEDKDASERDGMGLEMIIDRTIGDGSRSVKDVERKEREALCKKNMANLIRDKKKRRIPLMVGHFGERDYDEHWETRGNFSCDETRANTGDNSPVMILDSLGKKKSAEPSFTLDSNDNSATNSNTGSRRGSFRNYEFESEEKVEDYIPLPFSYSDDLEDEIASKKLKRKMPIKNKIFAKLS